MSLKGRLFGYGTKLSVLGHDKPPRIEPVKHNADRKDGKPKHEVWFALSSSVKPT
jgi:hypothetical protein